jgi:hypothetical protein
MSSQDKPNVSQSEEYDDAKETKYMWIAVGLIVLVMVGGMGINMLIHHETSAQPVEMSAPQQ